MIAFLYRAINYLVRIIDVYLVFFMLYFLFFVLLGLWTKKNTFSRPPEQRFAVIVPAHNEEPVIANLLDNLKELDYPQHLYDIVVIADNCQDKTAEIASRLGARVITRFNDRKKGKGHALRYCFQRLGILSGESEYDAVVIIDADNLVETNFLKAMNSRLLGGERLIQSYLDSKNPSDSWVAATFSMVFWINNRFNLLSRYNVGFSSVLMGTGMCISSSVLEEVGWDTKSLTEDLEFSVQALTHGIKTAYAYETKIYDEKPAGLWASCRQRLRWARGQLTVAFQYIPQLLKEAWKRKSPVILEGGLRLFQLFFILVSSSLVVLRFFNAQLFGPTPVMDYVFKTFSFLGILLPVMPFLLPSLVFFYDKLPVKPYRYLLFFPLFLYSWGLILYWALFTFKDTRWMPTTHTSNIRFSQLSREGASRLLSKVE